MPISEIVSDTGPVISFEKLPGGFSLLRRLCHRILIPTQVLRELEDGGSRGGYLEQKERAELFRVVSGVGLWRGEDSHQLDPGERAAIELARRRQLPLLIEERLGRRLAQQAGLSIVGSAGLVLRGCRVGDIQQGEARQALVSLGAAQRIGRRLLAELLGELER